jgi:hypothetical protein
MTALKDLLSAGRNREAPLVLPLKSIRELRRFWGRDRRFTPPRRENRLKSLLRIVFVALFAIGVARRTTEAQEQVEAVQLQRPQNMVTGINVRVHNYAHLDAGLLVNAEAIATRILREAKVNANWVYCPLSKEEEDRYPICPSNWGTNAFVLNILTPEMAARLKTPVEALGSAPSPCDEDATSCPISLMYFRVEKQAEQFSIQPERLLGHVLAHEVGHMLGANHSSKGIMRGEWGRDDLKLMGFSLLEFSTDQAKQLRAALLRRAVRQELAQNVKLYASR